MKHTILQIVLGKWFFLVYFVFGLVYFVVSALTVPCTSWPDSFFTTLGLLTGSDPFSFKESIESHQVVWGLAWIIHIGSWLLIPALVGLLISDISDDIKREQRLQKSLTNFVIEAGVSPQEASELVSELRSELEKMIAESERKGEYR